jgi:hypothetical protein
MGLRAGTRATGSVSAQALGPSAATSTVAKDAASIANDGVATCTVTATIRDVSGGVLAGVTPVLTSTGTGNTIGLFGASDATGQCSATFKSTQAETKTLSVSAAGRLLASTTTTVVTGTNDVTSITSVTPSSGPTAGGTACSAVVVGATGTPAITVKGTAATSVVVVSSTSITFLTPAGTAGAGDVVIGTQTSAGGYTYVTSDEPADPGSGYLWSDNFDRYASVAALLTDGTCGVGTPAYGLPNADTYYGKRTKYFSNSAAEDCTPPATFEFTTGRLGTGNALRSVIPSGAPTVQWRSPSGDASYFGNYSGSLVMQIYFRLSTGARLLPGGCKWFEAWYVDGGSISGRVQNSIGIAAGDHESWKISSGYASTTDQPVGPYWETLNDGNWHRYTFLYRGATTFAGGNPPTEGSRDGICRVWIDGTKIIDVSATAAGVTPAGGTKAWCSLADVDQIFTGRVNILKFPDVFNGLTTGLTIDHDDLKVWAVA